MSAVFSALQVADLFDAQAAEAPIHRLVSVLNAQAVQIRTLQEQIQGLQAIQQQTLTNCENLRGMVAPLGDRLGDLEGGVTALQQSQTTAGRQLEDIGQQLAGKADRHELEGAEMHSKTSSERLGNELRNELASLELVQYLQTQLSELQERMETVDRQLAFKMDKSESTRLDGILSQINAFRPVTTDMASQLLNLQAQQETLERSISHIDSEQQSHHNELGELLDHVDALQGMVDGVEERHHRAVAPQIIRLDGNVTQLQDAVHEIKSAAATSDDAARKLSLKLNANLGALTSQLQQQHRHFERALAEKAPHLDIAAELVDLNRQLTTKVSLVDHKALSTSVQALQSQTKKLQHHVKLSTRFVNWFARRGEAYEHNLELVETQLERLAHASQPRDREPFGDRVCFPRSP